MSARYVWGRGAAQIDTVAVADAETDPPAVVRGHMADVGLYDDEIVGDAWCVLIPSDATDAQPEDLDRDPAVVGYCDAEVQS